MSVARSRRCCVHDATHFTTQRFLNKPRRSRRMDTHGRADFTGKVVFVTGAASGMGRAAALAFAREGASVGDADVSEQGNQETARMIEEQGGRALAVRCDVTRGEDVKAALAKAVEAFGRLDVAFNNAGVEPKQLVPTAEVKEEEWDRIINIDLRGVFLCMKYEIPLMLEQGGGAIVNTSSGAGIIGIKGNPAYTAAKHGVIGSPGRRPSTTRHRTSASTPSAPGTSIPR